MRLFDIIAALVTLTALASYVNHRYVRLHPSVGVMLIALLLSLALIGLGKLGLGVHSAAMDFLDHVHFGEALLTWMLGFLLFAGALTVDINELRRHWGVATLLATVGTAASMFAVAGLAWAGVRLIGLPLGWIWCLLFGALISPTDPVAVMALMKQAGAGKAVETVVASESLFNDGVGVVLFLTILHLLQSSAGVTAGGVARMLMLQAGGAAILGFLTGLVVYALLRHTRDFQVEVSLTLALAMGTYSLAAALGMSAPIAVVVAGLLIGNRGRIFHLAEHVNADLQRFWELIDEMLNAVLFLLIGAEVLVMHYTPRHFLAAMVAIPIVLSGANGNGAAVHAARRPGGGVDPHLGRPARRVGGRHGPVAARRTPARSDRGHHLRRRLLLDPRSRHNDSRFGAANDPLFIQREADMTELSIPQALDAAKQLHRDGNAKLALAIYRANPHPRAGSCRGPASDGVADFANGPPRGGDEIDPAGDCRQSAGGGISRQPRRRAGCDGTSRRCHRGISAGNRASIRSGRCSCESRSCAGKAKRWDEAIAAHFARPRRFVRTIRRFATTWAWHFTPPDGLIRRSPNSEQPWNCGRTSPDALNNLGNALFMKGELDWAITAYENAVTLKPELIDAQINLANALDRRGRRDEALAVHLRIAQARPDHAPTHLAIGDGYYVQGRWDDAIESYRRADRASTEQ